MSDVPMLKPYRRHAKTCPHRSKGRAYTACKCPISAEGFLKGQRVQRSLNTRSWSKAIRILDDWEYAGAAIAEGKIPTIAEACVAFLKDAEARQLAHETLRKLRASADGFRAWCRTAEIETLRELSLPALREYRASWKLAASTASKELERLRSMFQFFSAADWCPNYARQLRPPKVVHEQKTPITREQFAALISACDTIAVEDALKRERLRCWLWSMRYMGLRIQDATQLHESQMRNGHFIVRQGKVGRDVMCVVPAWLVGRLEAVKNENGYFFKPGSARADVDAGNYRRDFSKLRKLANLPTSITPHNIRHAFAYELLAAGTSIEDVSMALGHNSTTVTIRHYAAWGQERQARLDKAILAAFSDAGEGLPAPPTIKPS